MSAVICALIRRAILTVLHEFGGEHNHSEIAAVMNELGHRVSRRDIVDHLKFLAEADLVAIEPLEMFTVATITGDGVDLVEGKLTVEGVSRFKAGL